MSQTDDLSLELQREAPRRGEEFLTMIEGELPSEANLRMELTLIMPRGEKAACAPACGSGRENGMS